MNDNIKDLLRLIEEHPDLPVIPVVGQDIVADCTGEWIANFGKAEIRKICMYEEAIVFYHDFLPKGSIDSLDWLEAIIVHVETPTLKIPDSTEKINESYGEL